MDPNYFEAQTIMFKLSNMLFGLLLIGFCLLAFYAICKWCSENEQETKPKDNERLIMKPVYAHEIEPGIVILQNEEGDYFKILKEYDSKTDNLYGSVSCTKPEVMQPPSRTSIHDPACMQARTRVQPQPSVTASAPPRIPDPQGNLEINARRWLSQKSAGYGTYGHPPPYTSKLRSRSK